MFCKRFPFQIMRWKTLSYIVASFFCIFLMRENIKKLRPSFRARRSPKFLAKNRFSVTSVRYYIWRTLWCKIWQFFRLTELPFKKNFVNITEPGWKIIDLKKIISDNFQILWKNVSSFLPSHPTRCASNQLTLTSMCPVRLKGITLFTNKLNWQMLSLSQGGWEIDIVITVMAVLNKYKDAVLLGEPYLSSGTLWSKTY